MLVIAGAGLGNSESISRMVMRSEDSWRRRITRVIQELRENNALDDDEKTDLVLEDTFSMAVPLEDNRTSCGKRLAQGLRLTRAIQAAERNRIAQNARLHKTILSLTRTLDETVSRKHELQEDDEDGKIH